MAVTVLDYIGEEKGRPAEHLKNAIRYILNPRKTDVGRILRTFKIKKNVEVTDNGKIII